MKKGLKDTANVLLIIFLCFCLIFFSFGTLFLSSRPRFSEVENRPLATLPLISAKALTDGEFMDGLRDACRDGIPFRNRLLALRGYSDLILRGEIEGVIFGKDGYLIPRGEYTSLELFEKNISFFEDITRCADISVSGDIVPRPIDVNGDRVSYLYRNESGAVWDALGDRLGGDGLFAYLAERSASGEEIWYKTDHHWTALGAYYAYSYLGDTLGYSPYKLEDFQRTVICDDFLGSSYSLTGGVSFSQDKIELFRYDGDENYTVTADGEMRANSLYVPEMLDQKDKYRVFLGGNYGKVTIEGKGERERLLIIKDSYANSLVPFLARHFDIEMIDLRYFSGNYEELYSSIDSADLLLILQGADTLATTGMAF